MTPGSGSPMSDDTQKEARPAGPDWGAGHYERTAQVLLPAARVLVDAAAPRPTERVLDLGTGTGNAALLAAAAGAEVTAVDPSARLLSVARQTAEQRGLEMSCEIGDASALPAPDGHFDCVVSNFAIIFAPEPQAAVAEVARVLRVDGRVLFTAWLPGGAVGALASATREMVQTAVGAPPSPPPFSWHQESAVADLFGLHSLAVDVVCHDEIVFKARSPRAFLEAERENHPMAASAFQVFRRAGQAERAEQRLLEVLVEHNEDAEEFRSTSRYVVLRARR